jgi:hypothetical protein
MSGEMDAAGGMATAGLAAAAIEPPQSSQAGEGPCLNCGAALNGGLYCAACGQPAHANRSLWALIEELLWNVFNLDTKAWRTLPRLALRPGTLTRTYIDGKRARYLTPLATFLLCYFFMFLVFSLVPKPSALTLSDSGAAGHVSDARDNLKEAQEELGEAQQGLAETRRDAGPHPNGATQLALNAAERGVAIAQRAVARRQAALTRALARQGVAQHSPVHIAPDAAASMRQARNGEASPAPPPPQTPAAAPGGINVRTAPPPTPGAPPNMTLSDDDGPITLDDVLKKIASENLNVNGKPWLSASARAQLADPPRFYDHLQDAASRWGFLLLPLSLPFIAFLFLFKKNITLYDHTVFALNSLSFASLLFAVMIASALSPWLHWVPGASLMLVLPVHTFFHVGGAYRLKWWSALWRTWLLLFFSLFVLIIFFLAVLFIGLSG